MGIEPTHQLVTGALVLKYIKDENTVLPKPAYFLAIRSLSMAFRFSLYR